MPELAKRYNGEDEDEDADDEDGRWSEFHQHREECNPKPQASSLHPHRPPTLPPRPSPPPPIRPQVKAPATHTIPMESPPFEPPNKAPTNTTAHRLSLLKKAQELAGQLIGKYTLGTCASATPVIPPSSTHTYQP